MDNALAPLQRLVGSWATLMTHPMMPGQVVSGTVHVEWLEGEQFLIHRARTDHELFPDSISIIGFNDQDRVDDTGKLAGKSEQLRMQYFDSRGVFRIYDVDVDPSTWRIRRTAPGMSQRFTGTWKGDDTLEGLWQMSKDGQRWHDDLQITYTRKR